MRDRLLIFSGLFLFVVLFTYPLWHGIAANTPTAEPKVKLPPGQTTCVAPRYSMRTAHMALLTQWRDGSVRERQRRYQAYDGKTYKVSLTGTCLEQCHGDKAQFCDRCHAYAAVSAPDCWDCHTNSPAGTTVAVATSEGAR